MKAAFSFPCEDGQHVYLSNLQAQDLLAILNEFREIEPELYSFRKRLGNELRSWKKRRHIGTDTKQRHEGPMFHANDAMLRCLIEVIEEVSDKHTDAILDLLEQLKIPTRQRVAS